MKIIRNIALGILALPGTTWAQSTLVFPRIYPLAELKTTGFAVVNPGATNANVLFTLYKPVSGYTSGSGISGTILADSRWVVPSKGQLAKLGSELFPDAPAAGWVEVTSTVSGLQGFWIGGDFVAYADGADAASSGSDLIFPLVAGKTELNITNLGRSGSLIPNVIFRLVGSDGMDLTTPASRSVHLRGAYQAQASDLFPDVDLAKAMYIRATAPFPLAGTEVVRGFLVNTESAVLNAVAASSAGNTLNFVQAISGTFSGASYTTVVGVINLGSTAQTVTITFNPESGGKSVTVQRSLAPKGALRETLQDLFGFSTDFQNGWVQVSAQFAITGFITYANMTTGAMAAVPAPTKPQTNMLLDQIAGGTWYTGIALLNTSTTDANVEVFALTPGGTLIGGPANVSGAAFTLPGGRKIAKVLSEIIPATAAQNGGFLYVRTTNDVPLYGIGLFGSNLSPVLSNVATSGLAPGLLYTPPSPSDPVKITSIYPTRASRGSTVTLSGNGFGFPESNNTVVFATTTGTAEAVPATASLTTMTVVVPDTAITGAVFVRTGARDSPPVILEVTTRDLTIIQNPVVLLEGKVTENADIYVAPGGVLQVLAIGVANVGSTMFYVGPSPADLQRGQTRDIVVVGPGISTALRSTVTILGSGVTVLGSGTFQNGVIATVKVDAGAEAGPRTVLVTNSNLDSVSMPGGVFIR